MEEKSLFQQLQKQAEVVGFLARFGFLVSRKGAETLLARLWYSDASRKRNAWPLKTDLMVSMVRAGVGLVPPSIPLLQQFQLADMAVPSRKASVLACSLEVPNPISFEALKTSFTSVPSEQPASPLAVKGEWVLPASRVIAGVSLAQSLSTLFASDCPITVYCHGGAYCFGSAAGHRPITVTLAVKTNGVVLSVDYRLAPEHPFPAGLQDVVGAYQWLIANGVQANRIVMAGDSAGGGIIMCSMLVLNQMRLMHAGDQPHASLVPSLPLPAGGVCMSGWFDVRCSTDSWGKKWRTADYLPHSDSPILRECANAYAGSFKEHPFVSCILAPEQLLSGLPPMLFQVGGSERLLSDIELMSKKLTDSNVSVTLDIFPNEVHVFQAIPGALSGKKAVAAIAEFIKSRVHLVSKL